MVCIQKHILTYLYTYIRQAFMYIHTRYLYSQINIGNTELDKAK